MRKNAIVLGKKEMKNVLGGNADPGLGGGDGGPCWTSCIDEGMVGNVMFEQPQLSLSSCEPLIALRTCNAEVSATIPVNCWCTGDED